MMLNIMDKFFPPQLCASILKSTDSYQWTYGHKSDMADRKNNRFFVCNLWTHNENENFFFLLWKIFQKKDELLLEHFVCRRIIANGQVMGQDGNYHTDHWDKTIVYFPLDWKKSWGGSTFFNLGGSEREVRYCKNRIIIFDADTPHFASSPAISNVLRISLAFNLELKKGDGREHRPDVS